MSRRTIRASIVQFFTQPPLQGLPLIRSALEPQDQLVALGAADPASSFGVIYMPSGMDKRLSTPARTPAVGAAGIKLVTHEVHLQVCHYFEGTGAAAMDDCDGLIEDILTRLRSDARIGQDPTVVFEIEQGEGKIRWRVGETTFINDGEVAVTWFGVMFSAVEQIQA